MPLATLTNLSLAFGTDQILDRIELSIESGERIAFTGRNGAGKSTLFSLLCGIEKADSGQITILNKNVTELKSFQRIRLGLGLKFQTNKSFQSLSIKDNLSISDNNFDIKKSKIIIISINFEIDMFVADALQPVELNIYNTTVVIPDEYKLYQYVYNLNIVNIHNNKV